MVLKVSYLVRKKEGVRHEFVVDWEEALQTAYNNAENVFLSKVVHERISVESALPHFNDVKIMVSESHAIPQQRSITRLIGFTISVLADNVLDGI